MDPGDSSIYLEVFVMTLALPYVLALLLVLVWAVLGRQPREDRIRRIMIGVAWTTAAALFVNSMFLNGVGRIILFGLMTFLGIGLYAVWERKDTA